MSPQMYPINWIFMFIFFSMNFYMFLSYTYFFKSNNFLIEKKTTKMINLDLLNSWKNCW